MTLKLTRLAIGVTCCCSFYCTTRQPPEHLRSVSLCSDTAVTHTGVATYYDFADGGGNCCFPPTPDDLMVGAMNHTDYDDSYACGSCVSITGPDSGIMVRIVDQCPECQPGHIDLSPLAFSKIAALEQGIIPITWKRVPCPVTGPIVYHFKKGSNQWWTAVQIRNHRYPVLIFEVQESSGTFTEVQRTTYNYFVKANGMGKGPFTFRITDLFGHRLTDTVVFPALDSGEVAGSAQFPLCE